MLPDHDEGGSDGRRRARTRSNAMRKGTLNALSHNGYGASEGCFRRVTIYRFKPALQDEPGRTPLERQLSQTRQPTTVLPSSVPFLIRAVVQKPLRHILSAGQPIDAGTCADANGLKMARRAVTAH